MSMFDSLSQAIEYLTKSTTPTVSSNHKVC